MGLFTVIKLLLGDWLLPMLEKLPETMKNAGEGIIAAGDGAINAGKFIKGGVSPNARETVDLTADIISDCKTLIENAAALINTAGNEIGTVKVPTVTPTYVTLLNVKVVSGLQVGDTRLFGQVADNLKNGADDLESIGTKLHDATSHLHSLSTVLNDTGSDLSIVGMKLKESGNELKQLAGS